MPGLAVPPDCLTATRVPATISRHFASSFPLRLHRIACSPRGSEKPQG
jgi:hypothetical protein